MPRPTKNLITALLLLLTLASHAQTAAPNLLIERPVHSWEFLDAVGMRAGIFGAENGRLEAWVYPMKLLRDFHLVFHRADRAIPAEALARTVQARPESTTIIYSGDDFTVRETIFVPYDQPGAVIVLELEAHAMLHVSARFRSDFQLMWPAGLGATYMNWNANLHAFTFGEESHKYFGTIGSDTASSPHPEFSNNYSAEPETTMWLEPLEHGRATRVIAIAGSTTSREESDRIYSDLLKTWPALREHSSAYYRQYLEHTTNVELPDKDLQQAYDWARISMVQGMVNDPLLGTGLVAGYRTSGPSARPGFAWFFGRDSEWTSLALDSIGDFANVRTALEFLTKFQRADGKIEHEIAQTASLVPWFTGFPYGFASADATPLFIIAMEQYARFSGDTAFITSHWENLHRAYSFLRSTWDAQHHALNQNVGHGWVEGGPLLPVSTELYQSGLGAEAVRALSHLAQLAGHADQVRELDDEFKRQQQNLERDFWNEQRGIYAFALNREGKRDDTPSVEATVPMWFSLLDTARSQKMVSTLAASDHMTDWGMRIISARDPRFDPSGYHFGSVWPLFTGWASVGEYRVHRAAPAFANFRANALLTLNQSPGRTTEVLSGAYLGSLSTSSPHQIWSSAMVVSPLMRGLMGLDADAANHTLTFAPHVPADWNSFKLTNVRMGSDSFTFSYTRTGRALTLEIDHAGRQATVIFSPGLSPRARVTSATIDGRAAKFSTDSTGADQHVRLAVPVSTHARIQLTIQDDFDFVAAFALPNPGEPSRGLRVISESWTASRDQLTLTLEGIPGSTNDLVLRGADQVRTIEGAELAQTATSQKMLRVSFPGAASPDYQKKKVVLHFFIR